METESFQRSFEQVRAESKALDNDETDMLRREELVAVLKEVVNVDDKILRLFMRIGSRQCEAMDEMKMASLRRNYERSGMHVASAWHVINSSVQSW